MEVITIIIGDSSGVVTRNGVCNHSSSSMCMYTPIGGEAIWITEEGNDMTIVRPYDGELSAFLR
eukprot:6410196-Heterocapsa_arctica.AAC.1